jgi:8-oxo-dGTP diphosphatase
MAVTVRLYSAAPKILLIRRGIEPFKGKLALPGGHVEAGVPDYGVSGGRQITIFSNGDSSVAYAANRELCEETGLSLYTHDHWKKVQLLKLLDGTGRDPRGDARRISAVFHVDLEQEAVVKAADDAAEASFILLNSLLEHEMAFDHWLVIHALQQRWLKMKEIWNAKATGGIPAHECREYINRGGQDRTYLVRVVWEDNHAVLWIDNGPGIGHIKTTHCPMCGADLRVAPF